MLVSGSWDGTIKLWDVASGALCWSGLHASHLHLLAFAPDSRTLASSGPDAAVRLWDVQDLDRWIDSLKEGSAGGDDILRRLP